ncbi:hypothetical protein PHMEG_00024413 [Phytophthora megakarya]|uniref:Reverse transcriptase n=1 Tax=Phytophthora megakarya TaxID=4795 RepID=A0A225VFA3_9STRA|nr:hypothetical protein PHMEG_00024413 [Phytophthora megakarya]
MTGVISKQELVVVAIENQTRYATHVHHSYKTLRNGKDMQHAETMRAVASQYNVWADKIGFGPPTAVAPLHVILQDGAAPFRYKQRKYPPLYSQFLRETVQQLLDRGIIRRNNSSRWASAAVPVRKLGTVYKLRLTVDYRPVNALTVSIARTMVYSIGVAEGIVFSTPN